VVLTGNDEPALREEVLEAGAVECLRKSRTDGKEVLGAMTAAVRRSLRAEIARLRESETRYAGAFEGAPVGMALMAPDGRLVEANRSLADLVGVRRPSL